MSKMEALRIGCTKVLSTTYPNTLKKKRLFSILKTASFDK